MMAAAKLVLLPIVLAPAIRITRRRTVFMRDSSSVTWFKAGDRVRVAESVMSRGKDLRGRTGTVADAWEKCEEDPHCCCAELAEEAAAVTVDLDPPDARQYYFAENELAKLPVRAAAECAIRERNSGRKREVAMQVRPVGEGGGAVEDDAAQGRALGVELRGQRDRLPVQHVGRVTPCRLASPLSRRSNPQQRRQQRADDTARHEAQQPCVAVCAQRACVARVAELGEREVAGHP